MSEVCDCLVYFSFPLTKTSNLVSFRTQYVVRRIFIYFSITDARHGRGE